MKLFWKTGEPYVLATGAALAIILVMSSDAGRDRHVERPRLFLAAGTRQVRAEGRLFRARTGHAAGEKPDQRHPPYPA